MTRCTGTLNPGSRVEPVLPGREIFSQALPNNSTTPSKTTWLARKMISLRIARDDSGQVGGFMQALLLTGFAHTPPTMNDEERRGGFPGVGGMNGTRPRSPLLNSRCSYKLCAIYG